MIKDTIKSLNLSATLKINEKSKVIEIEGKNIIKFGFGPVSYTHLTLPTIYSV